MISKVELGERIRKLRLARNLTLKQVSAKAKVSPTHLSEIERGQASPTVGALVRIGRALGEDAARLVQSQAAPPAVPVRAGDRIALSGAGAALQSLIGPGVVREFSALEVELAPGARLPAFAGADEVFVLVMRGSVEMSGGFAPRVLVEGDAVHFPAHEAFEIRGAGDAHARVLWVAAPPFWM